MSMKEHISGCLRCLGGLLVLSLIGGAIGKCTKMVFSSAHVIPREEIQFDQIKKLKLNEKYIAQKFVNHTLESPPIIEVTPPINPNILWWEYDKFFMLMTVHDQRPFKR